MHGKNIGNFTQNLEMNSSKNSQNLNNRYDM